MRETSALITVRPNNELKTPSLLYAPENDYTRVHANDYSDLDTYVPPPTTDVYGNPMSSVRRIEKEKGGRNRIAYLKQNRSAGGMKVANDLERRVKGFRIPDTWSVYKDER